MPDATADKSDATTRFVYVASAISALGGLLFGYSGVISGAILFIKEDFKLTVVEEEVVVAAVLIGALFGSAAGGKLADRFGRRKVLIVSAAIFAIGSIASSEAPNMYFLIAGRIVLGSAIGAASFIAPLYISEISPGTHRGRLVSINQIGLTGGILISYVVAYALSGIHGWRWMFRLGVVPALALFSGMLFMPESPRWLLLHGFRDKARAILKEILDKKEAEEEFQEIQKSTGFQANSWADLFSPRIRPALVLGIGLAVFQQVTGINTIIYYAPTILEFAGFKSDTQSILATVGVGVLNVVMTVIAMLLLDRVGRRPLLLAGLAGMALSLLFLGVAFDLPALSGVLAIVSALSLMIYVGSFAVGLGPVFWLLISEIYPLKVRGRAMSVATTANWGANLIVTLTFLSFIQMLGKPLTFWIYGLLGIGALLFAYFLVPETKGQSLEDIEAHWWAGKKAGEMGKNK